MKKKGDEAKDKKNLELTEGSEYIVTSIGSRDEPMQSSGKFSGYISIGNGGAICLELDRSHKKLAGKYRIIPEHMILAIDVIKVVDKEKEEEKESTSRSYL